MRIDSDIANKIKRTLADNITNEYKDKLMENKAQVNIITTNDHIPNELNNTKDETHIKPVGGIPVKK